MHGCVTCKKCLPITTHCPICTPCYGKIQRGLLVVVLPREYIMKERH